MHKSKRYRQRHRVFKKYRCKKHWKLDELLSSFTAIYDAGDTDNHQAIRVNYVISMLKPLLPFMIRLYEYVLLPREFDYRSGFDTYGYNDNYSILNNLEYISDRWKTAYRVRWLINLVDKEYTYKGKQLAFNKYIPNCTKFDWNQNLFEAPINKFVLVKLYCGPETAYTFYIAKRRKDGTFITKDELTKEKIVLSNVIMFKLFRYEVKSYYNCLL